MNKPVSDTTLSTWLQRLYGAVRFGIVFAIVGALLLAGLFTVIDWYGNPGGIFRGDAGTNWQFVYDTWISWFLPSLVPMFVYASLGHLFLTAAIRLFRSKTGD